MDTGISLEKARLLIELGKPDAAIVWLREALRSDPDNHIALHMYGHCELLKGHYEEAVRHAERALGIEPNKAGIWLLKANALLYQNELTAALHSIEEALRLAPHHADCHAIKGAVLLRCLKKEQALIALNAALRCDPENVQALSLRSLALSISDQQDLAAEDVQRALRSAPNNARAMATRAWGEFVAGRISTSREGFRSALSLDPTDGMARKGLTLTLSAWPEYQAWIQRISTRLESTGSALAFILLMVAYLTAAFRFLFLGFRGEDLLLPFLLFILLASVPMLLVPKLLRLRLLFIREGPDLLLAREKGTLVITALLTAAGILCAINGHWSSSGLLLYLAVLVSRLPLGIRPMRKRLPGLLVILSVGILGLFFTFGTEPMRVCAAILITLFMFGYPIHMRRMRQE